MSKEWFKFHETCDLINFANDIQFVGEVFCPTCYNVAQEMAIEHNSRSLYWLFSTQLSAAGCLGIIQNLLRVLMSKKHGIKDISTKFSSVAPNIKKENVKKRNNFSLG